MDAQTINKIMTSQLSALAGGLSFKKAESYYCLIAKESKQDVTILSYIFGKQDWVKGEFQIEVLNLIPEQTENRLGTQRLCSLPSSILLHEYPRIELLMVKKG